MGCIDGGQPSDIYDGRLLKGLKGSLFTPAALRQPGACRQGRIDFAQPVRRPAG